MQLTLTIPDELLAYFGPPRLTPVLPPQPDPVMPDAPLPFADYPLDASAIGDQEASPDPRVFKSSQFVGPFGHTFDLHPLRRALAEKFAEIGVGKVTSDDARRLVGQLGDGHLIDLFIKYGPSILAVVKIIAMMFGIVLL